MASCVTAEYDFLVITADDFPTIAELAAALRTSERNVRRAISNGDIPAVKVSSRVVRVPLAEFIGKSATGGASAEIPALVPAIPIPSIPVSSTHTHAHNSESA
jgi:excisionase family DNA binding protein